MRNASKIIGLLAGYTGYKFATKAFNEVNDDGFILKLGASAVGFGFGCVCAGMAASGTDSFIDALNKPVEKEPISFAEAYDNYRKAKAVFYDSFADDCNEGE